MSIWEDTTSETLHKWASPQLPRDRFLALYQQQPGLEPTPNYIAWCRYYIELEKVETEHPPWSLGLLDFGREMFVKFRCRDDSPLRRSERNAAAKLSSEGLLEEIQRFELRVLRNRLQEMENGPRDWRGREVLDYVQSGCAHRMHCVVVL